MTVSSWKTSREIVCIAVKERGWAIIQFVFKLRMRRMEKKKKVNISVLFSVEKF
jgi:hypothetical protein